VLALVPVRLGWANCQIPSVVISFTNRILGSVLGEQQADQIQASFPSV
jgi:hypothetical protein